jgi:hypothetical protein
VTLVIGTDEAGYGPNLGPLVVAATAWRVAAPPEAVEETILEATQSALGGVTGGPLWGDSKKIYRAGAGLDALERGVLVALSLAGGGEPAAWQELAREIFVGPSNDPPPEASMLARIVLPRHRQEPSFGQLATTLRESLLGRGVAVEAIRCRVVQPAEFNRLLDRGLNKSDILSQVTLDLAATLATAAAGDAEPVVIWCDRHGGRRRYAPQIAGAFDASLVQPLEETPRRSVYRFGGNRRIEFSVGGESRLPVAVASMTAKYLRELAMLAFNGFWQERQPGLAATAGYPVDAARWRREATAAIEVAGLPWDTLWRRA